MDKLLTGQIGHGFELLLPELGDLNGLLLHGVAAAGHPLRIGVGHDLLEVLRIQGVEDVKQVLSGRSFVLCPFGREKRGESRVLFELGPDVANR